MNVPTLPQPLVRWPHKVNEIPKEVFDREDVWRLESQRIFHGPEWHPVAHEGEIPNLGDFKTFYLAEVPLLIVRGEDNQVRVFFNSCAHRGNQLETATCGNKREFECPYHRWLFDSTGRLRGAPSSNDFSPSFTWEKYGLTEIRTAASSGLIFVTMSDQTPDLDTYLGRIKPPLTRLLGGDGRLRLLGYQKVIYTTNWKAYADNDGYHAPLLHAAFKLLNWQGGKGTQSATENGHMVFDSELTIPDNAGFLEDASLIEFRGTTSSKGSIVLSIFPLTVLTKHLDMINVRFAIARGADKTEVHYAYFHHADDDADMIRHRLRQSSNMLGPTGLVSMEDASVFHRIQVGSHTPGKATFQKGVAQEHELSFEFKQNDESGNLPRWEHYRKVMGFEREET